VRLDYNEEKQRYNVGLKRRGEGILVEYTHRIPLTIHMFGYLWEDDQTVSELSISKIRQAMEKADLHNLMQTKMSQFPAWYDEPLALDNGLRLFPKTISDEEFEWKLGKSQTPKTHKRQRQSKISKRKSRVPQRIPVLGNCAAAEEPTLKTTIETPNPGNEGDVSVTRNLNYMKSDGELEALLAELAPELLKTNQL